MKVVARRVSIIAGERLVGGIGNAVLQHLQVEHAEQRIAAADLRVEEAEGKARVHRLDPQRDFGQLHRHRVAVHPVDAAARDIAQRMAEVFESRSAALTNAGKPRCDAAGSGQQEVTRAAGGVDDRKLQQRLAGSSASASVLSSTGSSAVSSSACTRLSGV